MHTTHRVQAIRVWSVRVRAVVESQQQIPHFVLWKYSDRYLGDVVEVLRLVTKTNGSAGAFPIFVLWLEMRRERPSDHSFFRNSAIV